MQTELVKDWMNRGVIIITPDTILPEAHRLMISKKIRRLPVVEEGRLVGKVTRGAEPSGTTSLSIWEINYLLSKLKIDESSDRQIVGIITGSDIFRLAGQQ